ncbi:MAG TPA: hypothetical protein VK722_21075 [Candidatus Aquilonibacter sp.]|jgi:hypothetical protein|nr:hypothetical protein [Candidatus Aquilonibacter sp.]
MSPDTEFPQEKPITPNPDEESNARTKQSNPDVLTTQHMLASPLSNPHYEITCKTEKTSWDKFKDGAEIVGICLLAVYTWYSIKMYCANRDAANAASSAAKTAENTLIVSERPWVVVDAMVATGPLRFLPNGRANVNLSFHIKNIGQSIASNIYLRPQMMGNIFGQQASVEPFTRQAEWCDSVRKETPDPRFLKTLFPHEDAWQPMGLELTKEEIESSSATYPVGELKRKFIVPLVYGCVNYQFPFSKDIHQTRFIFNVSHPQPKDGSIPPMIRVGEDVPISNLATGKYFFGGTFGD